MTAALLILLNVQLSAVIVFCVSERRSATRYRDEALGLIGGSLDVDLLTAVKSGVLRRNRKRPVVAVLGDQQEADAHGNGAQVSHGVSVTSGADGS